MYVTDLNLANIEVHAFLELKDLEEIIQLES